MRTACQVNRAPATRGLAADGGLRRNHFFSVEDYRVSRLQRWSGLTPVSSQTPGTVAQDFSYNLLPVLKS
jgi:hypothetical protein